MSNDIAETALQTGFAALEQGPPASVAGQLRRAKVFSSLFGRSDAAPLTVGRFTLLECIGVGGMGELYAAYDPQLDRKVAIKLVRPDKRGGAEAEQRLLREARVAARLSHPNVVQVFEAGTVADRVFITMEFVRGQNLREWLLTEPRGDQEILRCLIEAGRGLAAVHEAGLAHRDFKPANALLGDDGRVRIVDFGLARDVRTTTFSSQTNLPAPLELRASLCDETTSSLAPSSEGRQLGTLTEPGAIMGTPRYMAPEQRQGVRGDARSDQFSFCVALYEALYGVLPFTAEDPSALLEVVAAGQLQAPQRAVKLPRRVREAIVRGLDIDPERRWPSMDALLVQLEPPPAPSTKRWIGLSLVAALAVGAAFGAALLVEPAGRCTIDEAILADSWGPTQRLALEQAFAATGSSFASASAVTVSEGLDAWATRWRGHRREACEATWVEGVQSEALLDLRTACLDRKRVGFETLVETFVGAERDVVVGAAELLEQLPELGECSNPRALTSGPAAPSDPAGSARVLAGYETLTRARVLAQRGRKGEARELAELLVGDPHPPLAIEARAFLAQQGVAVALEPALLALRDAANEAEALGLLELEASIRVQLAREAAVDWSKPELEGWLIDEAEQLLTRLGQSDDPRWLSLLGARALHREQQSDYAGARELLEQGIALASGNLRGNLRFSLRGNLANLERKLANYDAARAIYVELLATARARWGDRHPSLASVHYNLGVLALDRGAFAEAREWLDEARVRYVEAIGAQTIAVAEVDFALAKLALSSGEFERAQALIRALLPIFEAEHGPEHESTARAHAALGVVQFYLGELEGSLVSYRRALPVFERILGPDSDEVALMHANVGESLLGLGRPAEAEQACDRAVGLLERVLSPTHPYLGVPLKVRGIARLELGHARAALDDLERAVSLLEREADEPLELADARFALARALLDETAAGAGAEAEARAQALIARSIAGLRELGLADRAAAVEAWRPKPGRFGIRTLAD